MNLKQNFKVNYYSELNDCALLKEIVRILSIRQFLYCLF